LLYERYPDMAYSEKKTIFIIDDSENDMELTKLALKTLGPDLSIRTAMDGRSALAMLRRCSLLPSLVLVDLKMPGMDGIEVVREMRLDNHLRNLPVVVVTSSTLPSEKLAVLNAGANDFVRKHYSLDRFIKELELVLDRWAPDYA
jgi:two-component system, response regulator